ncbi:sugar-transfer associated ATP-grasp domain-containing protein [Natronoglycomyces albus]|uniref:Alpha-L-glutamate ligase-related protein ATP-grasp domain-containing protein n=1 Tax=Natronoglycomyces albus TaxID=2811108 RepID=A0A895XIM2_9ACTN|nr:sugar-transfer associated ATP-grasp domain-containing protein [Natronoglycomyces albus]QSB04807.1 hypothetical protein JQS30_13695 [Natronoglycomyces albus]
MPQKKRTDSLWKPLKRSRLYPMVWRSQRRRWRRSDDVASRLHLLYWQRRDDMLPAYFAKFDQYECPQGFKAALRWYALDVGLDSLRQVKRYGSLIRTRTGMSRLRQLWQVLWWSAKVPMTPKTYYHNEMYRPEVRQRYNEFLHRHELKGVLYLLAAPQENLADIAPLNDKSAFADKAQADGLPVVGTVALIAEGDITKAPDQIPRADLFVKPRGAKGGKGAQLWIYQEAPDSFTNSKQQLTVERSQLLEHLSQDDADCVVQRRLIAHPELADLTLDAVPTLRLITFTNESGDSEVVAGAFRMPAKKGAVVDNFHAGGIAAPIDVDTGTLGPAISMKLDPAGKHSAHPVTGAAIDGRVLPGWEDILEVTHRAHQAFAPRVLVGWDICMSKDGPILVEGNEQPGIDLVQRLSGQPLGTSRFGQLLAHHIDAHLAATKSA